MNRRNTPNQKCERFLTLPKAFLYFFILFILLPVFFNKGCKTAEEAEVYDIRGRRLELPVFN